MAEFKPEYREKLPVLAEVLDTVARAAQEAGAALTKVVVSDVNGKPASAVIAVRGGAKTAEVLAAVGRIEAGWKAEEDELLARKAYLNSTLPGPGRDGPRD